MNASCNEAKRPRKWFLSIVAAIIAVVSCASIMTPHSAYAEPEEEEPTNIREECISSGAAKSLGWIVCPVMLFMADSAEDIYGWLQDKLEVNTDLLDESMTGGQATHDAWHIFQGFANIAFGILLMVVVISQISGIGITNYGIKKILPKLIVTAVIVNISYYLCLILVDVSNIVGSSILNLLTNMGPDLPTEVAEASPLASAGMTALTAVPIALALVGGVIAVVLNPAILLGLLVSLIGLFISLMTLLVMLSAREAIIVVLIVVSPLAFVCYMLPNTKKIFDRWLKISEGMLLLYPVCGLLIGGGNFVSKLLMNAGQATEGFAPAFTALLVGIVPIFFIPTVVKKAFAAAGDIGGKIATAGSKFRGNVENRARKDPLYKDMQRRGMERQTRINAGLDKEGKARKLSGLGTLVRGGERNIADARAQFLKDQVGGKRAESMNGAGFEAAQINQQKAFEKEELGEWVTLINDQTRNGEDETKLFQMYDDAMREGNKSKAVAVARIAGRRKDTAARFLDSKITGAGLDAEGQRNLYRSNEENIGIFSSVAKEVATGENSGSYRESSPIGFQFAASHNRYAGVVGEDGKPVVSTDYSDWGKQDSGALTGTPSGVSNVGLATNNYITNTKELMGAKNKALNEIAAAMADPSKISATEFSRLQGLAKLAIENKGVTGTWDSTKEEVITRIAGMTRSDVPPRSGSGGGGGSGPDMDVPH